MKSRAIRVKVFRKCSLGLAIGGLLAVVPIAHGQLLYSFETGTEGWELIPPGGANANAISVTQSAVGATHGSHSLAIETGPTYSWNARVTVGASDTTGVFDAFSMVAADLENYLLEFDVTITPESFANVTTTADTFFMVNTFVNSDGTGGGFHQVANVTPDLLNAGVGVVGTHTASIPMTQLPLGIDSSYFQLNIGSNSTHVNGPQGEGVSYYIDNVRFRQRPVIIADTLFSFETPDDPATPDINEQFEGWVPGFHAGHAHSITTTGATHGTSALNITRSETGSNFTWGSQFLISSDTNPDPEVAEIDPAIQARIDDLIQRIHSADSIAFDVTVNDTFPASPTYARFGMHFTDETGVFYGAEQPGSFNWTTITSETTATVEIPLSLFEANDGRTLLGDGLLEGTSFLRIGLSSNMPGLTVGGNPVDVNFQIDNIRLLTETTPGIPGDYNQDGIVDAADYTVWRDNLGRETSLPNDDSAGVDEDDYLRWKDNFGQVATGGMSTNASGQIKPVPEPGSVWIVLCGAIGLAVWWRRRGA